ncbi:DedA family protein [Plantactinospora sp. WMMB334]|uniref:DedA family protein n=1 Tax=Plantactinospora sp. WMMB334 TaxID=3404119 RepID=UPI003B960449
MLDHLTPLLSSPWLYVIVFAAVAIDGFIPVVPTEVAVIGLGALSATGSPNLVALAAVVVAGGIAGDRVSYLLGRKAGGRVTDGKLAVVKKKAERSLMRYGGVVILVGRFLPYGRTTTALAAGAMSVPLGRFRLFSALASAAWAVYAIGLGLLGGATFAGSPLLGALCAMAFGAVLAGVFSLGGKWRGTAPNQRAVTGTASPDPALVGACCGVGQQQGGEVVAVG